MLNGDGAEAPLEALLRLVYRSASELALVPLGDLLGSRERINVPGTVDDVNWTWRMPIAVDALHADAAMTTRLAALARDSRRT